MEGRLHAIANAELLVNVTEVNLHGDFADEKPARDLSVREPVCRKPKYFSFAPCQALVWIRLRFLRVFELDTVTCGQSLIMGR